MKKLELAEGMLVVVAYMVVGVGLTIMAWLTIENQLNSESAGEAAVRQEWLAVAGQWESLYDELLPSQAAVIDRGTFVRCSVDKGTGLRSVTGVEAAQELTDGDRQLVILVLSLTSGQSISIAKHETDDDGWRWELEPAVLAAYSANRCPG